MAAKNIDVLDGVDDDTLAAVSFAGGAQDWVFSCGVCHVGGGQLEFDRNRETVTSASPDGDYYQFYYPSQVHPDPTGVSAGTMVTATEYAETDCMMCHAGKSKTANVVYQTMGCDDTNPIGPMNDRNCDGDQDHPMFGMMGALTVTEPEIGEYDMYNRNHALKRHKLSLAPSMGLGAVGVNASHDPAGNDAATSDDSSVTPLAAVDWGTASPSIPGAMIKYAPDAQNCTVCHGRDDNTLGLPGMLQMKTGFGNYFAMEGPGSGYNNANDNLGTVTVGGTSDNWDFELGCKPGMGKRGHRAGHGPHDKWGMSMLADQFQLGVMPGTPITDQEFDLNNDGTPEIVVKEDIPDIDVHDAAMVNDGSGARTMRCSDCHYMFGKDNMVDETRGQITGDGVYLNDAGEFRGVHYPAHEIHAMDHQFGTGNSMPDNNSMDYLDDTVTCQSCHDADATHPKLAKNGGYLNAPVPLHNGMPPLHLERIGCETCHNPAIYAAPGKKKYRDWSVGFYKNSYYRNMLDWNYDMITGSYKPTQPSHMWMTKDGETKIYPFFPSFDPMWMDDLTITEDELGSDLNGQRVCGGNSEMPCSTNQDCIDAGLEGEEAICEDVDPADHHVSTQSMMKNRIMNRAGEYFEEQYLLGNHNNYVRRNEGFVAPLFDGFSLADSMVIDTKADIDYMLDTAFPAVATAAEPNQAGTYKMYQKTFDVTHGTVPKEWALGGEKRGGCVSCHSSADPRSANYSPNSVGFFEGINQPHHYAGKVDQPAQLDWLEGQGVGGVDYVKNWFSAFADYDCTALCNPEAAMTGALAAADATYFDQTANGSVISGAACTSSSMFSNSPMTGTTGACLDADLNGDGTCSNDPYGMGAASCNTANNYDHPMAPGMNHDCDMNGVIDMCTGMMGPAFDTMMGFPPGAASQMGMLDGIAGLQAFVVKEGYNLGYGGCNPMGGVTSAPLLQGMAGTVNMCMPNYADAGVAAAIDGAMGAGSAAMYAGMINGACAGADLGATPPTPGACNGGFRNTGYCYADADCQGAMTDLNEVFRNPQGRINTRDAVRKAYKLQLQQSIVDGRKRLDWEISAEDRNGAAYSWNQADICIDPMQSNLMQTVEVPCTDGGFVQTVVHANQFLGYSDTMLNVLMTPQQSGSAELVVKANFSALASTDTNYLVTYRTDNSELDDSTIPPTWTEPAIILSSCYAKLTDAEGIMYTEERDCTYSWDFTDGTGTVSGGNPAGTVMPVTYSAAGTYTATLTMCMEDDPATTTVDESSVCDTQAVQVEALEVEPPAPDPAAFSPVVVGNTLTMSVSGMDFTDIARVYVYWGDRKRGVYKSPYPNEAVHTYRNSGTYDIEIVTLDANRNTQTYDAGQITIP